MKQCIKFSVMVTDGVKKFPVDVPEEIVDHLPANRMLTINEAIGLGLELGTEIPMETIRTIRKMNAISNEEIIESNTGEEMIPTLQSVRERVANPNIVQVLKFFEPLETAQVERPILKTECSVPEVLPVNGIYIPIVEDNSKYEKIEEEKKGFCSALYAEKIVTTCRLFREDGQLYIFVWQMGCYKKLRRDELKVLIDEMAGVAIRKANFVKAYDEITKFLCYDSRIEVKQENLLPDNYLVFRNGLLDTNLGNLSINDGRFFVRTALQCQFCPEACCPIFDTFLTAVTGGNESFIELLWEVIGYILFPENGAKVFFALVGEKDTGKSLFADVLTQFFTSDAISTLSAADFAGKFDVQELKGKRLNICMDLPDVPLSAAATAKIKSITGGDIIRSDVKFQDSVSFRNDAKILFGSNSLLRTEVPDPAFTDRLITMPFVHQIPKEKQDKCLLEKISCELSGIARKAIPAFKRLKSKNFVFPEIEIPEDLGKRFDYDKVIMDFAKEVCEFTDEAKIFTENLCNAFEEFCRRKKLGGITKTEFSTRFNRLFSDTVTKRRVRIGNVSLQGFLGVRIRR